VLLPIKHRIQEVIRELRESDYDDPDEQMRRARMLSAILLLTIALMVGVIAAHTAIDQTMSSSGIIIRVVAVGGIFALYRLTKSGHYRSSAVLFIVFSFAILAVLILELHEADMIVLVSFLGLLNLPVLMSSSLLSLRWTIAAAALNLALTSALLTIHFPDQSSAAQYYIFRFNLITSAFIVILTIVRFYDRRQMAKQARALRTNEARLRHLFEAISDPICVHEQDRITSVNPAFEQLFGYTQAEILGKSILDFVEMEARPLIQSKSDSTETERFEMRILHKDGTPVPVELTSRTFSDAGHTLRVTVARDMTLRKQMEDVVETERHLLRTVIDNIPDYIYVKDRQRRFLLVNQALQKRFNRHALIGKTDHDIMAQSWADMYAAQEEHILDSGEAMIEQEYFVPAADSASGEDIWLLQTKIPLRDPSGAIIGLVGINRDITAQKQMERRLDTERNLLRTVIDNIPDEIYVKDAQGRFILTNQAMETVYGGGSLIGKTDYDFIPPADAAAFQQQEQALFANGQSVYSEEIYAPPALSLSPQGIWLHITKVPLRDSSGKVTALVGINRDITRQKETELRLEAERNLLRTVIDHLPNEVFIKDSQHRFVLVNRAVQERWKIDLIGKTDADLTPHDAQLYMDEERHILETGQPFINKEVTTVTEAGHMYWFLSTKVPLRDHTGQITGLLGINVNITPLKQIQAALTEERNLLRAVTDNIPDRIYVKDRECRFVMVNRAVRERWAAEGIDSLIGRTDFDLFDAKDAAAYIEADRATMNSGQPRLNYEYKWVGSAGDEHWVVASRIPLYDSNGLVTGLLGINRDITEHKRAELALIEERNLLSTVIENIPEHIYVKNRDHVIILGNRALHERWGRNVIGLTDRDLLPPDQAEEAIASEAALMESGEPLLGVENKADFTVDDRPMWLLINKVPLRDQNGQIVGLVGINRDITALKLAEIQLREERNLLRSVIDAVPDHLYVKDTEHRFVLVNKATQQLWPGVDVIGKTDYDVMSEDFADPHWEQEEAILKTGQPLLNRELLSDVQSAPQWLMITKVPLRDSEGRIVGLVGVNRDITERRLFEEQLRYHASLLENVSDAVISTDLDLTILSWNRGAEAMYGWRAEEAIGKKLQEVVKTHISPEDRSIALGEVEQKGLWEGEIVQLHRNGTRLDIHNVGTPIRDYHGNVVGYVAVNRNITERKQAEQQRVELAVERERVKILQQVISDMSHDLKNPLANFRTSLYLLEKFIDNPTRRGDFLAALDSHTKRLEALLDDLLSIARLEQATDEFHFEPVDVCDLVMNLVDEQQNLAARRRTRLIFNGGDVPAFVQADRLKLNRALTNLIMNAINYTPDGGEVQVGLRAQDGFVIVDVQDNGIGIQHEHQELIFERFYRVDKARSSATGGTGLGLSIALRIAEAHGGKITVESEPGVGSLFSLWLPTVERQ
jgi:PAS domain S-box-containing protein